MKNLLSLNSTLSTFTTDQVKLRQSMLKDETSSVEKGIQLKYSTCSWSPNSAYSSFNLSRHCWEQMFEITQKLLDPASFGWECVEGRWEPLWPKVSGSSSLLVNCGCKKAVRATVNARKSSWSVLHYATAADVALDRGKKL